jgi:tetraacyldisaccharide 4'-kinase
MKIIQILLYPFAFLYAISIKLWSWMYKMGYWGKANFSVPIISVGNIQAGGTGKTPMVEYLCSILTPSYHVSVLSRGYKRLTFGFRIVSLSDGFKEVGDEPAWLKRKYPQVNVGVAENRIEGIPHLVSHALHTDCIILDDGFQQQGIRADLNILLTTYHAPFTKDHFLPVGKLREGIKEAKRADIIIVTKCPEPLLKKKAQVLQQLKIHLENHQTAFLSSIYYATPYLMNYEGMLLPLKNIDSVLLLTGIADASPLVQYIESKVKTLKHLKFSDHYRYRIEEIELLEKEFEKLSTSGNVIILTTEKDAARLVDYRNLINELNLEIYVQPILLKWDDEEELKKMIFKVLPEKVEESFL